MDTFTVNYTENVVHAHAVDTRPSFSLPPNQANFWLLILTNFYGKCAELYIMQTNDQSRCILYKIVGYTTCFVVYNL